VKNKNYIKQFGTIVMLLILVVLFSISTSSFLTFKNGINILRQVSVLGILSVGMTFVMVTGGMDLSVGSLLALTGVICAQLIVQMKMASPLAILVTLVILTLFGLMTGALVVQLQIPPMIITLGMMTVARGLSYIITGGLPVYGIPDSIVFLGQGYIGLIPVPVITMLIIVIIGSFVLNKTYQGRFLYAIGGNEEAARLAGVAISKIKIVIYGISGLLAGIAGITLMGRLSAGSPTSGTSMEMDVITAVVIGGVSINGGHGKISGAFVGALIIGVLSNGLTIMNVGEYYQMVVKGAVLIFAVAFDKFSSREKIKKSQAVSA
jgi:ribose transport system permease protein